MQSRRLNEIPPAFDPHGHRVEVPLEFWERLQQKDPIALSNLTLANPDHRGGLIIHFLNEDIRVDIKRKCLRRQHEGKWEKTEDPLLELITLLYLLNVKSMHPLGKEWS